MAGSDTPPQMRDPGRQMELTAEPNRVCASTIEAAMLMCANRVHQNTVRQRREKPRRLSSQRRSPRQDWGRQTKRWLQYLRRERAHARLATTTCCPRGSNGGAQSARGRCMGACARVRGARKSACSTCYDDLLPVSEQRRSAKRTWALHGCVCVRSQPVSPRTYAVNVSNFSTASTFVKRSAAL